MSTLFDTAVHSRLNLVPRDYQVEDLEQSFTLWDAGSAGTLTRIFTGGGKTVCACQCFDRWLARGPEYHGLVLSYEQQLVWQFAEEIEHFMGITPGIEMDKESLRPSAIPRIVVASRQTLQQHKLATQEQRDLLLSEWGLTDEDLGLATVAKAKKLISDLRQGLSPDEARYVLREFNARPECDHETQAVSRLHKFDWKLNWLVVYDEAHKFSLGQKTSGPIHKWFARNPESRHKGLTATPKRFDGKSLAGMFPGVSIDFPLVSVRGRCALRDGYAVPYVQRYIEVEGVDFASLRKIKSETGFDESRMEELLLREKTLTSLCDPLLDMVGDRRTLIFNPGVEMAKAVAAYINVRSQCRCDCGKVGWYPTNLIGDGAKCRACGELLNPESLTRTGNQAEALWGEVPHQARKDVYRRHKAGAFQFLSVCGLCKEGFNDPEISCVAVFRKISKAASALAEQMKGRASRPLRGLIEGMQTAEERLEAIRTSGKPDALIIDMTGITELPDCATTVQLYAEGAPDEVIERAEKYAAEGGVPVNVLDAIDRAYRDIAAERDAAIQARKEAEQRRQEEARIRAQAQAQARYTTHDTGHGHEIDTRDPNVLSAGQEKYIARLGMRFVGWMPSKHQAGRIIDLLLQGKTREEVAYLNHMDKDSWMPTGATVKQVRYAARLGINVQGMTAQQASEAIDKRKNGTPPAPNSIGDSLYNELASIEGQYELERFREKLSPRWATLSAEDKRRIGELGKQKRDEVF